MCRTALIHLICPYLNERHHAHPSFPLRRSHFPIYIQHKFQSVLMEIVVDDWTASYVLFVRFTKLSELIRILFDASLQLICTGTFAHRNAYRLPECESVSESENWNTSYLRGMCGTSGGSRKHCACIRDTPAKNNKSFSTNLHIVKTICVVECWWNGMNHHKCLRSLFHCCRCCRRLLLFHSASSNENRACTLKKWKLVDVRRRTYYIHVRCTVYTLQAAYACE